LPLLDSKIERLSVFQGDGDDVCFDAAQASGLAQAGLLLKQMLYYR